MFAIVGRFDRATGSRFRTDAGEGFSDRGVWMGTMARITFRDESGEVETRTVGEGELAYNRERHHWEVTLEEGVETDTVLLVPRENVLAVRKEQEKITS